MLTQMAGSVLAPCWPLMCHQRRPPGGRSSILHPFGRTGVCLSCTDQCLIWRRRGQSQAPRGRDILVTTATSTPLGLEMEVQVLLLLALTAPTIARRPGCDEPLPVLDPALRNVDLDPSVPSPHQAYPVTADMAKAMGSSLSADFHGTNLMWEQWTGSTPKYTVSIYNGYMSRWDYVCKYQCSAGYYNPDVGAYCVFPYGGKALQANDFQVLVNKDNFEILEWKEGAYGSVAWNAVKTCEDDDVYVGKNQYGLGKVVVSHRVFYLPYNGWEYSYDKPYQFLIVHEDVLSEHLTTVRYHTEGVPVVAHPPEMLKNNTVSNSACDDAVVSDTLTETSKLDHKWENNYSLSLAGTTSITTKIPFITSAGIQFSVETTVMFTTGTTYSETTSHAIKVQTPVPAGHMCVIHMVGKRYGADVPYTADLKRTYRNGETKWTTITGTYKSIQISEVQAVVGRCEPLPNVKPC
uniref:natterin-3-like n=1 Tax=Doryrhamphus excisus TaxID=161450 RepID=UPI0025AE259E|nr:natterin-3-like [Doryrhamphus excisus]